MCRRAAVVAVDQERPGPLCRSLFTPPGEQVLSDRAASKRNPSGQGGTPSGPDPCSGRAWKLVQRPGRPVGSDTQPARPAAPTSPVGPVPPGAAPRCRRNLGASPSPTLAVRPRRRHPLLAIPSGPGPARTDPRKASTTVSWIASKPARPSSELSRRDLSLVSTHTSNPEAPKNSVASASASRTDDAESTVSTTRLSATRSDRTRKP